MAAIKHELREEWPPRPPEPPGAVPVYPTAHARAVRNKHSPDDPNAIRCAQCGAPIENQHAEADCWLCGSDNFQGKVT